MNAHEQWIWVARIRRSQGRRGEVLADLLTDFPEKFSERKRLWLFASESDPSPREVELIGFWPHKAGVVLHFSGIDSISDAETLTGLIVAIHRSERAQLGEDEVYICDMIGCTLIDVANGSVVNIGEIEDVDRTAGPVALLVVRGAAREILIPFAKAYLRRIDFEARRVEMALPEGLADINEPESRHGDSAATAPRGHRN